MLEIGVTLIVLGLILIACDVLMAWSHKAHRQYYPARSRQEWAKIQRVIEHDVYSTWRDR